MMEQIAVAAKYKPLHYQKMPFVESFWLDHRQHLIDFMMEE
jgi:hypothetical protein